MSESLAALVRILRKIGGYMTPDDQLELFRAEQLLRDAALPPAQCCDGTYGDDDPIRCENQMGHAGSHFGSVSWGGL